MDWLLGCFKCRQRRPIVGHSSLSEGCKDGCAVSPTAALLSANSAKTKESGEVERILLVEGDELKRNSSAYIKSDKRARSARGPSSEQLLLVEKLEEEIDSLNKQLMEEATQATSLTNEVKHLRKCSALLDSPHAFKKALSALEQVLEKGHLEESQPLLYLHSLLSKIESSEEVIETSPEQRDEKRKYIEAVQDKGLQVEPDHSQGNIFAPATNLRESDGGNRLMLRDEQRTCNSRPQHLSNSGHMDANKTRQISVVKRRSSTTLSFSGFLVAEDVLEERLTSDKAASVEAFSRAEVAVTKIIEKTDFSNENLLEASKSLFAFTTDISQGHSTSTRQSVFGNISKDFSFSNSDSEDNAYFERTEGSKDFLNSHYRPPSCMWSPQDDGTHGSDSECVSLSIDATLSSYHEFSEADEFSLSSTCCDDSVDHISSNFLDSEESDRQRGTEARDSKGLPQTHIPSAKGKMFEEQGVNSNCRSSNEIQAGVVRRIMDLNQLHSASSNPVLKGCVAYVAGSEVLHCSDSPISEESHTTNRSLEKTSQSRVIFSGNSMHSSLNEAPLKVLDKITGNEEDSLYRASHVSPQSLSHGEFSLLGGEAIVELSSPLGTTFIRSPDMQTSPYAVHTLWPQPVDSIEGYPSGCLSETPSTPVSVNSYESRLHLAKADATKLNFTPLRTPSAFHMQTETRSTGHSQGSPSSLGEDRPILGTVAAHWNPSPASTQKWWDGKGIPNSTNKYKEDQKVSWHATPFEVRLERALAKQGRGFQKKLFTGAMATDMEANM